MIIYLKVNSFLIVYFLGILVIFNNCKNIHQTEIVRVSNNKYVKKVYYLNGKIKIERQLIKSPTDSFTYDGFYKKYYEDGTLNELAFYKNGVQDSVHLTYNSKGVLIRKDYMESGKFKGLQYNYFDDGKIKTIVYAIDSNNMIFKATYDLNDNIIKWQGHLLWGLLMSPTTIKTGESFRFVNIVMPLSNCKNLLHVKMVNPHNRSVIDDTISYFYMFDNRYGNPFSPKFTEKGLYKYNVDVTVTDTVANKLIGRDSANLLINVVE